MFIDPVALELNPERVEEIERASLRFVTQALLDFRVTAAEVFRAESDLAQDKGEDITREALDAVGVSRIPVRLFGKIDYKRARYFFHPDYAVRQALFIDSKAEQAAASARIQIAQTSLVVRQVRQGQVLEVPGRLPKVLFGTEHPMLTTTIFVKFDYVDIGDDRHELRKLVVAALPNGFLQARYNPTPKDGIWIVGPDAPTRGEDFRTRLSFQKLKAKANWRVQTIPMAPSAFTWDD